MSAYKTLIAALMLTSSIAWGQELNLISLERFTDVSARPALNTAAIKDLREVHVRGACELSDGCCALWNEVV